MSGTGGVVNQTWDGVVPPECRPNPSILRLSAGLSWEEAYEPLHKDIDTDKTCGVGPGMPFVHYILDKDSSLGVVGLVPCAIGGTNISEWAQGTLLYNQLVRRAGAAVQGGGTITALLWYQGESDTVTLEDAKLYKSRLEKFFTDLRNDLLAPMLPVIQMCGSKGSQLEPDYLHLSTPAQVNLGEMLANAYLQTVASPVHSSAPKKVRALWDTDIFSPIPLWKTEAEAIFAASLSKHQSRHAGDQKSGQLLGMMSRESYADPSSDKSIFLLAGQSNMAGRGSMAGGVPEECQPNPSILRLTATLSWEVASDPLHRDIDIHKTCGVGPGMPFANSILKGDSSLGVVGLVPCAIGGTRVVEWQQGTPNYTQLLTRAKAAVQGGGTIRALLWYQGESDTKDTDGDVKFYKDRVEKFLTDIRADLNLPTLPVLLVALATGEDTSNLNAIRAAQLAVNLPNVIVVDAYGAQTSNGDPVHLATPGQVVVGKKLAAAFIGSPK
ncbi:unnamed protein product [Ilex paraguariensis]|uniref:Sialate O-acetylesterase domain-containing protein n=1 Tax=Ilex paraguariensis TaxID=185542 RepID=A0ABC8QV03_9AQUA